MTGGQRYYSTIVLGGSGAVYQLEDVAYAFCHECRCWIQGHHWEITSHAGAHRMTS